MTLLVLGSIALLHALLDLDGRSLGETSSNSVEVFALEDLAEAGSDNIIAQGKSLGDDDSGTGVVRGEGSDSSGILAFHVDLSMEGSLGEDCHLASGKLSADGSLSAVAVGDASFRDHFGVQFAVSNDENLVGSRVLVEKDHAAGCYGRSV